MIKVNFNLRKKNSRTLTPINIIIRYKGLKFVYPSNEKITPSLWSIKEQLAKPTKQFPQYPEFNTRLRKIRSIVENTYRKYLNDNEQKNPSVNTFRELLDVELGRINITSENDLLTYMNSFISESESKVNSRTGKFLSYNTKRNYRSTFNLFKEYTAHRRRKQIDFSEIDLDFYFDLVKFLKEKKNHSNNSIGGHIKILKSVLRDAEERGIEINPAYRSKRFITIWEKTDAIYMNEDELNELLSLDLSENKRLERVRDLFIVGCWTGLRFSDFRKLRRENFKGDFIEVEMQKTGDRVNIPIHHTVSEIMQRYETENHLPPPVSNQKMNEYLKEIGAMINRLHEKTSSTMTKGGMRVTSTKRKYELLTTHTARRSFATNLYLSKFPVHSIMKITGHKKETTFYSYIKLTPNEEAKLLQLHWKNTQLLSVV